MLLKRGNFINSSFSNNFSNILFVKNINVKNKPYYLRSQLWFRDLKTNARRLLIQTYSYEKKEEEFIETYTWHPNNVNVLVNLSLSGTKSRLVNINTVNGIRKKLPIEKLSAGFMGYSKDGNILAISVDKVTGSGTGKSIVQVYYFKENEMRQVSLKNQSLIVEDWSSDNNRIAMISRLEGNDYAPRNIVIYNIISKKFHFIFKGNPLEERLTSNIKWSLDNKYIAFNSDVSPKPPTASVWIYDIKSNKSRKLILPKKLANSKVVGWQNGSKKLLLANKVGLWEVNI